MDDPVTLTAGLFNCCDDFLVRLSPKCAVAFAEATVRDWPGKNLEALITSINVMLPKFSQLPDVPQDNIARHYFMVGREQYHPVLHVRLSARALATPAALTLEMALKGAAREFRIFDAELLNPGQAEWDFRYWWS